MLDVMAGYDPDDPVTALGLGRIPATYTASLNRSGLRGARIGVLSTLFGTGPDHQEVNCVMANALEVLNNAARLGQFLNCCVPPVRIEAEVGEMATATRALSPWRKPMQRYWLRWWR